MSLGARLVATAIAVATLACAPAALEQQRRPAAPNPSLAPMLSPVAAISASPAPSAGTAAPSATASPGASSPSASPGAQRGLAAVEIRPLANPSGEHIFITRSVQQGSGVSAAAMGELWVVPLANGADARAVVRYPGHGTPWLSSRISPDGTRYAFSLDRGDGITRIAIADLRRGSVSWLRTDDSTVGDAQPAWDPTGTRIALARTEPGSVGASVWVVNVDGSGLRRLVQPGYAPTYVHEWTADGRAVAFYEGGGYDTVDVATGTRVHMDNVVSADASWRTRSPRLLIHGSAGERQQIIVTDDPATTRTVLVATSTNSEFLGWPRWRPGADEFLYTYADYVSARSELRWRTIAGQERMLAVRAGSPTWTTDGSAIVYMRNEEVPIAVDGPGRTNLMAHVNAELRVVAADGTGDRLVYRGAAPVGGLPPSWCVCNDALAMRRF